MPDTFGRLNLNWIQSTEKTWSLKASQYGVIGEIRDQAHYKRYAGFRWRAHASILPEARGLEESLDSAMDSLAAHAFGWLTIKGAKVSYAREVEGPPPPAVQSVMSGYAFRIRFRLPEGIRINADSSSAGIPSIDHTVQITLKAHGSQQKLIKESDHLVIVGGPFSNENEAQKAGRDCQTAAMVALTRMGIGFDFGTGDSRSKSCFTLSYLQEVGSQINATVLNDEHGLMTYDARVLTRFALAGGKMTLGKPLDRVLDVMHEALSCRPDLNEKEMLAFELFGFSQFEESPRARFLTQMIAVEALLDPQPRAKRAVELVQSFIRSTKSDPELERSDRDSLLGTLKYLPRESINKTGRTLAASRLGNRLYGGMAAVAFFRHCYQVRSDLVHYGRCQDSSVSLGTLAAECEGFVADLLCQPYFGFRFDPFNRSALDSSEVENSAQE